jgi:hypothetical protein
MAFNHPPSTATDGSDVGPRRSSGFDSQSIDTLYAGAKLSEVQRLTPETYQLRAYTPLIDACCATIKATEEIVAQRRDKPRIIAVFQRMGTKTPRENTQLKNCAT